MRKLICRCIAFFIYGITTLVTSSTQGISLKCLERNPVSFNCQCCPPDSNSCTFKKLFQPNPIFSNGSLKDSSQMYEPSPNKTLVTLKECLKDSEGTYVWKCADCTTQFHLEVESSEKGDMPQNKILLMSILIPILLLLMIIIIATVVIRLKRPKGYTKPRQGRTQEEKLESERS